MIHTDRIENGLFLFFFCIIFLKLGEVMDGWLIKCPLTRKIISCFRDFQRQGNVNDVNDILNLSPPSKRFNAKCKLCDENAPEKSFIQGNNTNLKTHLKRVCFCLLISCQFVWNKRQVACNFIFDSSFFSTISCFNRCILQNIESWSLTR